MTRCPPRCRPGAPRPPPPRPDALPVRSGQSTITFRKKRQHRNPLVCMGCLPLKVSRLPERVLPLPSRLARLPPSAAAALAVEPRSAPSAPSTLSASPLASLGASAPSPPVRNSCSGLCSAMCMSLRSLAMGSKQTPSSTSLQTCRSHWPSWRPSNVLPSPALSSAFSPSSSSTASAKYSRPCFLTCTPRAARKMNGASAVA
mmetsp:Transcript_98019/g.292852  ORF Transcript_98019/g.292852 Transcript_98019/m.292852 type:complete len:202 (+) Transcript_98019:313-918(+)